MPDKKNPGIGSSDLHLKIEVEKVSEEAILDHWLSIAEEIKRQENAALSGIRQKPDNSID